MHNTYSDLAEFGKKLLNNKDLDEGLIIISEHLKKLTGAMRCSIFVHNIEDKILWTILANGLDKIVVPEDKGVVGYSFMNEIDLIENTPHKNPYFLKTVDLNSGYETMNMLVCPIYDSKQKIIGVVQLINKLDGFNEKDMLFIKVIIRFISTYIEVALIPQN